MTIQEMKSEYDICKWDVYGSVMNAHFDICEYMDAEGMLIPDEWEFQPGAMGSYVEPDNRIAECGLTEENCLELGNWCFNVARICKS